MRFGQAADLHRSRLATAWRAGDLGGFGDVGRHRQRDTAQQLNPFGQNVDQQHLGLEMLVVHQMQLVEGRANHLPVVLFVHVAQRHGVGQALVEQRHAVFAHLLRQAVGQLDDIAVLLGFVAGLLQIGRDGVVLTGGCVAEDCGGA